MTIANVVALSRDQSQDFQRDSVISVLCDGGFGEEPAEAIADAVSHCFLSERFNGTFSTSRLKVALVRARIASASADTILAAIDPCVVSGRNAEVRSPVRHPPAPGRVVMCDFSFLRKPEMQKERRAIVISRRGLSSGRVTVVPVSKSDTNSEQPHHHKFEAGRYQFFHAREPVWAVCDHVYTVSLNRLWQVNVNRRPTIPTISDDDLANVRRLVGTALGVYPLTISFPHGIANTPAEEVFSTLSAD